MARYRADLIETAWAVEHISGTKAAALTDGWGIVNAGITLPDPRYEITPFYGLGVDNRNLMNYIQGREVFEGSVGTVMLCHDASRLILGDSIGQIFNATPKIASVTGATVTADKIVIAGGDSASIGVTAGTAPTHIVVISQTNNADADPYTDTFAYVGAADTPANTFFVHHSMNTTAVSGTNSFDAGWQGKIGAGTCRATVYSIARSKISANNGTTGVLASDTLSHTSSIGIRETLKQNSFTLGSKISADNGQSLTTNYMGNKVGSIGFNFAENSPVTFSIDFTGQDMVHNMPGGTDTTILKYGAVTAPAMARITEQPYFFSRANLTFGGVTFAKFRNLTLSIANQLDPRYYVTQSSNTDNRQILTEILEGRRAISISGTLDMDNTGHAEALASGGVQTGPDIKFLQYLLNQGFNSGDPKDMSGTDMLGVSLEIELRRFADGSGPTYDTITLTLPGGTVSRTNPGLILTAARMPVPAPPQVHQNIDIEGIARGMQVSLRDSV